MQQMERDFSWWDCCIDTTHIVYAGMKKNVCLIKATIQHHSFYAAATCQQESAGQNLSRPAHGGFNDACLPVRLTGGSHQYNSHRQKEPFPLCAVGMLLLTELSIDSGSLWEWHRFTMSWHLLIVIQLCKTVNSQQDKGRDSEILKGLLFPLDRQR